jgi:lysophospholipase L1-like esterase
MQAIFFGANDACLPGSPTGQHVPLAQYKQNLRDIIQHPSVTAQNPRLILLTVPPVCEYKLEEHNLGQGMKDATRTAEYTKKYADACRGVGDELGVAVLDVWSIMMAKTGWKKGEPVVGSKKVERSMVLDDLLVDGERQLLREG